MTTHPKSEELLTILKTQLACSEKFPILTNSPRKSGGNPSQFYYLLSNPITVESSNDSTAWLKGENGLRLLVSKDAKMTDIRDALDTFFDAQADKPNVSLGELCSVGWLSSQSASSADLEALLSAVKLATELRSEIELLPSPRAPKYLTTLSEDQIARLNLLSLYPPYVFFFAMRTCIKVDLIAEFDIGKVVPSLIDPINNIVFNDC